MRKPLYAFARPPRPHHHATSEALPQNLTKSIHLRRVAFATPLKKVAYLMDKNLVLLRRHLKH
jgi:hypothetical protein